MRVQDPDIFTTTGNRPRWYIRPFIDTFDSEGRPIKKQVRVYLGSVAAMKKREAITKKNEIMARINRSQVILQAQLPFSTVIDHYLTQFVRQPDKLSASTRAKYECHIENHIRPAWGDTPMSEIRGLEIDRWLTEKSKPKVGDRAGKQAIIPGLSWHTRTDLRNILSGIFSKAIDWGLWKADNPVARVHVGRKKVVRQHRKLTDAETAALLAKLPEDVRLICMTALFCTLRISEVLGLTWKRVDFHRTVFMVRERVWRGDIDIVKTERASRDVPIGDLIEPLRSLYPGPGHEDDFVFNVRTYAEHDKKARITRDDRSIHQHFLRPAAEELGLYWNGFGFHALRREAITNLSAELDIFTVMRMAGHAKVDMTLHYALSDPERQRAAVAKAQERIGKLIPIRKGA